MNKRLGLGIVFMGAFLAALLAGTAILQANPTRATTDNISHLPTGQVSVRGQQMPRVSVFQQ